MALKDILVHVDHTPPSGLRLEFALELARRHGARLAVLYARLIPGQWVGEAPESLGEEQLATLKSTSETQAAAAGVLMEWHEALVPGSARVLLQEIRTRGRTADLLIAGQTDPAWGDEEVPADLPEQLILGLGRPVIVVPYAWRFSGSVGRVLVAWDGSREAARAVNDALPLLSAADWVQLLAVNPAEQGQPPLSCRELALHLTRHGIHPECSELEAHDMEVGDLLLSRAADEAVDLLVTGGYGHARFAELMLGGVTRQLLTEMTLPVLMSH